MKTAPFSLLTLLSFTYLTGQEYSLVFYSGRTGNNEIFRMDSYEGDCTQLTSNAADDNVPSLSRDGDKIAFISTRTGNPEIFVMDINGNNLIQLTNTSQAEEHPEWSFDGSKLYYILDFTQRTEIWVMNADGSGPERLTSNNWRDERPRISPDGSTILFMSNRDGNYEIYTMDPDGKNQIRRTNTPQQEIFPTWSNDGTRIAYSLHRIINGQPDADIHVMQADGSNDRVLTSATGRDENAAWSPDGEYLFFQSERNGNFEIYRMRNDGTEQTRLTVNPAWDGWASAGFKGTQTSGNLKESKEIRVYPNPAGSHVNVASTGSFRIESIEVFNLQGRQFYYDRNIHSDHHRIHINGWPQGLYYVIARSPGLTERHGIVVR